MVYARDGKFMAREKLKYFYSMYIYILYILLATDVTYSIFVACSKKKKRLIFGHNLPFLVYNY